MKSLKTFWNSQKMFPNGSTLPFRSIFLHAWDLHDDGIDRVLDWTRDSGLNTICLASTYHSGWFIHPQSSKHRAFMTEGSVSYFQPRASQYKNTRLRPKLAALAKETDWFEAVGQRLSKYDLRLVAWTIGAHNTRLGLQFPDLTVQNVYGDRLPHALCPAQPEVREYLLALCRDLANRYPIWGIQLEAFGWLGFTHGHHHERDLVGLNHLEQELMGLCVCSACENHAGRSGIDLGKVRETIKTTLDNAFREAPQRPKGHPRVIADLEEKSPDFRKYNEWRKSYIDSLIAHVKQRSLAGTECRLVLQTPFDTVQASVSDGFSAIAYGTNPEETKEICRRGRKRIAKDWDGLYQCLVRLGQGTPRNERELIEIVQATVAGGCNGINFYNRSESPPKMLSWIKSALAGVAE